MKRVERLVKQLLGREPRVKLDVHVPVERHGSRYGGWNICPEDVGPETTLYSFGIGEDTSFEESLLAKYGMRVEAFDPTPRSAAWVSSRNLPPAFRFHQFGLGGKDETRALYFPADPSHVSLSIVPSHPGAPATMFPLRRLVTCMKDCNDDVVGILKMDIEGAEYEVIEDLLGGDVRPRQLLVEFHHRFRHVGLQKTLDAIAALRNSCYRLFSISESGEEYSFVHLGASSAPLASGRLTGHAHRA